MPGANPDPHPPGPYHRPPPRPGRSFAYSQFLFLTRDGFEPERDFVAAVDAEPGRIRDGWAPGFQYAEYGLYHQHLSRYYAAFDREQIRVYLYEDLQRDAARVLRDMYAFVGASPDFTPDLARRYNPSGVPKSGLLFRFYRMLAEALREKERYGLLPARLLERAASCCWRRAGACLQMNTGIGAAHAGRGARTPEVLLSRRHTQAPGPHRA